MLHCIQIQYINLYSNIDEEFSEAASIARDKNEHKHNQINKMKEKTVRAIHTKRQIKTIKTMSDN